MATMYDPRKDYYHVLQIPPQATELSIKAAYRNLALRFHPDKNAGCVHSAAKFITVHEAYEVLIDRYLRAEYDRERMYYATCSGTTGNGCTMSDGDDCRDRDYNPKNEGEKDTPKPAPKSRKRKSPEERASDIPKPSPKARKPKPKAERASDETGSKKTGTKTKATTSEPGNQQETEPDPDPNHKPQPNPPEFKPTCSTYWVDEKTMTDYYQGIRDAFNRTQKRNTEARTAVTEANKKWKSCTCRDLACHHRDALDTAMAFAEVMKQKHAERKKLWDSVRKIANELKAKKKEDEKRVKMADKARQQASARTR